MGDTVLRDCECSHIRLHWLMASFVTSTLSLM